MAKMTPEDRALAERVHATVSANPAVAQNLVRNARYTNADDKVIFCFKNSGNSVPATRHWSSRMPRNLDDGEIWPVSFAMQKWSPALEDKIVALVKAAVS